MARRSFIDILMRLQRLRHSCRSMHCVRSLGTFLICSSVYSWPLHSPQWAFWLGRLELCRCSGQPCPCITRVGSTYLTIPNNQWRAGTRRLLFLTMLYSGLAVLLCRSTCAED
ncbi:hypothetical protein PAXRUDRAFT_334727 [Paxillus rubicundulus Ve08.2h10]|uniref:Uncharacterized protein n=1 Tax=Paxillus rubicundulus Ve08.2h10 TaxID=930991 RepID=A0A0D0CSD2_9AGAM|nr:hypothetical protein PAXRUDRAFT_334727 [Paxillus rubicundulus Ve08.2h10]